MIATEFESKVNSKQDEQNVPCCEPLSDLLTLDNLDKLKLLINSVYDAIKKYE